MQNPFVKGLVATLAGPVVAKLLADRLLVKRLTP